MLGCPTIAHVGVLLFPDLLDRPTVVTRGRGRSDFEALSSSRGCVCGSYIGYESEVGLGLGSIVRKVCSMLLFGPGRGHVADFCVSNALSSATRA